MATAKRIYHTEDKHGARKLISAATSHQAVSHHAKSVITARVATPEDLITLTKAGVEDAGAEPSETSAAPVAKKAPDTRPPAALYDNIKAQAEAVGVTDAGVLHAVAMMPFTNDLTGLKPVGSAREELKPAKPTKTVEASA